MNLCSNDICTSCHAQPYEPLLSQFINTDVNLLWRYSGAYDDGNKIHSVVLWFGRQIFILIEMRTNVSDETVASIFSIRIPLDGCSVFPQAHNYLPDHSDTSVVKQLTIIITLWNKMSAFLGCHATQISNYFPTFWGNQSIPSSRVNQTRITGLWIWNRQVVAKRL